MLQGNDGSWLPISTAPFDRVLELAVIDACGVHAVAFPCRRVLRGWLSAETDEALPGLKVTHWRPWPASVDPIIRKALRRAASD